MFSRLVTFPILLIGTLMCAHATDVTIEAYELRFSSGGIPEGALPLRAGDGGFCPYVIRQLVNDAGVSSAKITASPMESGASFLALTLLKDRVQAIVGAKKANSSMMLGWTVNGQIISIIEFVPDSVEQEWLVSTRRCPPALLSVMKDQLRGSRTTPP